MKTSKIPTVTSGNNTGNDFVRLETSTVTPISFYRCPWCNAADNKAFQLSCQKDAINHLTITFKLMKWAEVERFNQKPFPGVSKEALQFLHQERNILFHGHEPLDTDTTPNLEGEYWLLHNHYTQAEGVTNLDKVPEAGALVAIGFAKPEGGTGGYARYIAICPSDWSYGVSILDAPGSPLPVQPYPLRRDQNGVLKPTPPES